MPLFWECAYWVSITVRLLARTPEALEPKRGLGHCRDNTLKEVKTFEAFEITI